MTTPKIIALDLDGTLFSDTGEITPYTKEQIRLAKKNGSIIVISSGRPFVGLPFDEALDLGIEYAITANGGAIYRLLDGVCLHEDGIAPEITADICNNLSQRRLHFDLFIEGSAYTNGSTFDIVRRSALPESLKQYILATRKQIPNLIEYILDKRLIVQKAALTFEKREDGTFAERKETKEYLSNRPEIHVVCGGFFNLEFTRAGVTKGTALRFLCRHFNIPIESSMACGDSENDLDILKTAGISVAMKNADDSIQSVCDYVTSSCNEDGVGHAIAKFVNGVKQ